MKKQAIILSRATGLIVGMCLIATLSAAAQEISTSNTSRYVCNGRWDWTIFIQTAPKVLKDVRCVEYKLHPSFPKPIRKVCSPGDTLYPFGLAANGWGTFEISTKIIFKSGKIRHLKHMLKFEAPVVKDSLPITVDNVATSMGKGLWKWTVFIRGSDKVLNKIQSVEYTLHPTFPDPVQEVCERGEGPHPFALSATSWGTFKIKIRVFLKDGRAQELTHDLTF